MAKALDAAYASGRRAQVKVKRRSTAECVVGGLRVYAGRPLVASLLLGLWDGPILRHVGVASAFPRPRAPRTPRAREHGEASGSTSPLPCPGRSRSRGDRARPRCRRELARAHRGPRRAGREGKVLVDWRQNEPGRSLIAPWSLRAASVPVVAAPLAWAEVDAAVAAGDARPLRVGPTGRARARPGAAPGGSAQHEHGRRREAGGGGSDMPCGWSSRRRVIGARKGRVTPPGPGPPRPRAAGAVAR